ncbi:MAG TPA: hypothetical protein DCE41_32745, partial [Cytophagales bacterium]|nr:hypothetical protein [Cytophagales bacterium]
MTPKTPQPPRWVHRFFRWFCHPDWMLSIEGDLLELFAETLQQKGPAPARRQFAWEVVKLFRPSLFRNFMKLPQWNLLALLRMQVVLSLRSYGRYRSTFLVNLLGLSLGLTSALL